MSRKETSKKQNARRPIRLRRRILFYFITILLGLILICSASEILCRFKKKIDLTALITGEFPENPMKDWAVENPYALYSPRPDVRDTSLDKTINNYGFFSSPTLRSATKDPDTLRVVFLGGSSTAGTGVMLPDDITWPTRAVHHLQQAVPDKKVELLNAAAGGYTSFESFGRLWSQVRFFEPDIVVVYHAWNDMYYFNDCSPDAILTWRWDGTKDYRIKPVRTPPVLKGIPLDRYLSWSQFYSVIRVTTGDKIDPLTFGEIGSKKRPEEELADHFDGTCIDVFRDNLKLIQGACDVMGAECYIVKQATLATPDLPPDLKKNLVHTWLHEFNYETHLAAFDQIYRMIDDNFEDAVVIDATALSGKAEYFNDHVHLSEPGGDALGKLVADHIAGHSSKLD